MVMSNIHKTVHMPVTTKCLNIFLFLDRQFTQPAS